MFSKGSAVPCVDPIGSMLCVLLVLLSPRALSKCMFLVKQFMTV